MYLHKKSFRREEAKTFLLLRLRQMLAWKTLLPTRICNRCPEKRSRNSVTESLRLSNEKRREKKRNSKTAVGYIGTISLPFFQRWAAGEEGGGACQSSFSYVLFYFIILFFFFFSPSFFRQFFLSVTSTGISLPRLKRCGINEIVVWKVEIRMRCGKEFPPLSQQRFPIIIHKGWNFFAPIQRVWGKWWSRVEGELGIRCEREGNNYLPVQFLFEAFFNTIGTFGKVPKWTYFTIPVHYIFI